MAATAALIFCRSSESKGATFIVAWWFDCFSVSTTGGSVVVGAEADEGAEVEVGAVAAFFLPFVEVVDARAGFISISLSMEVLSAGASRREESTGST